MTKDELNDFFFTFPIFSSMSLQFLTMQSFASLQNCVSSLAYQILLWHFQGLLSLQARLLLFWVSTIPISLFKSWYFSTFSISFSPTFKEAGSALSVIIYFCYFLSITIMSGLFTSITFSHWTLISTTPPLLHFLLLFLGRVVVHTTYPCVLANFSYKAHNRLSLLYIVLSSLTFFLSQYHASSYKVLHTFTFFPT